MLIKCPICFGKGSVEGHMCIFCLGKGSINSTIKYTRRPIKYTPRPIKYTPRPIKYPTPRNFNYPPPWDKNLNGIPDWRERGYGGMDGNPNTPF